VAEPVCLNCPKEYWIAFVLESQGEEEPTDDPEQAVISADDLEFFTCHPVSLSEEHAFSLSLVRNVVWLDTQGRAINDVSIDYVLCPDIEAHVNLREEFVYQKVLP